MQQRGVGGLAGEVEVGHSHGVEQGGQGTQEAAWGEEGVGG